MLTRLARWWLSRKERRESAPERPSLAGECICGRQLHGDDLHLVVALSSDDEALGIEGGRTAVSADFCAEHCPGGCLRGCVASEV